MTKEEEEKDQVGTLYDLVTPDIKDFIKSKIMVYGDSLKETSKCVSNLYGGDYDIQIIVDVMIAIKIERLKYGFANRKDYKDSLCDLLSYYWIRNNPDEYKELVELYTSK